MHFSSLLVIPAVLCSFIHLSEGTVDEQFIKSIVTACRKEVPVSDEVYTNAQHGKMDVNDRNLQCYAKCVFTLSKVLQPDGSFNMQVYVDAMTEERRKLLADSSLKCGKEAADDKDLCKKSMNMYECLLEHHKENARFI